VADVTRLAELDLPPCGFALDMGCFHGLGPEARRRYAEGLAQTLVPGGRYMLYTLDPHSEAGASFGVTPETVRAVFAPWFAVLREQRSPFGSRGSTWFWMERKQSPA